MIFQHQAVEVKVEFQNLWISQSGDYRTPTSLQKPVYPGIVCYLFKLTLPKPLSLSNM